MKQPTFNEVSETRSTMIYIHKCFNKLETALLTRSSDFLVPQCPTVEETCPHGLDAAVVSSALGPEASLHPPAVHGSRPNCIGLNRT